MNSIRDTQDHASIIYELVMTYQTATCRSKRRSDVVRETGLSLSNVKKAIVILEQRKKIIQYKKRGIFYLAIASPTESELWKIN